VRDGNRLAPFCPLFVHPVPQVFGIGRVEGGEGARWRLATEEDVAVQVAAAEPACAAFACHGGELIGGEGRENTWLIILFGRRDVLRPD